MERPGDFYWRTLLGLPRERGLPATVAVGKALNRVMLTLDGRTNGGLGRWL